MQVYYSIVSFACLVGFQNVFSGTSDFQSNYLSKTIEYLENQNFRRFNSLIIIVQDNWLERNDSDSFEKKIQNDIFQQNSNFMQYILYNQISSEKLSLHLNKSIDITTSSLFVCENYDGFVFARKILQKRYFERDTWLFINMFDHKLRSNNSSNETFFKTWDEKEIRLDSQIYFLNENESYASLLEVYKPCQNSLPLFRSLINFDKNGTDYLENKMIWSRRNKLDNCILNVAYVDQPPLISLARSDDVLATARHILKSGNKTMYGGRYSHLEIIQRLSFDLNFTIKWVQATDNSYGVFDNQKGTWNGLIKLIMEGDAEFSNAYLTVTPSRSDVVSFSLGFDQTRYGLFMKKPSRHSTSWVTFISFLHPQYWFALISISFLSVASGLVLFYNVDIEYSNSTVKHQKLCQFIDFAGSSIYFVLLALASLDVFTGKIKKYCKVKSFRYFIFAVCLFGLVNKETYTGGLISSFINQKEGVEIRDIEDLVEKEGHQLLVLNGTAAIQYFSEATESPNKDIWEKHLRNKPEAYFSRVKPIEENMLESEKYIYFERTRVAQNFIESYPCKVIQSTKTYFHRSVGLGMKKDSEYLELFNLRLLRYIETGVIANMDTFRSSEKTKTICKKENYESVGYESLTSVFAMLGVVSVFSAFICIIEIILNINYNAKDRLLEKILNMENTS